MGYALYETLAATGPTEALMMAIEKRQETSSFIFIHHSDRGVQYCCSEYVEILAKEKIAISMTQSGSPYEMHLQNGLMEQ